MREIYNLLKSDAFNSGLYAVIEMYYFIADKPDAPLQKTRFVKSVDSKAAFNKITGKTYKIKNLLVRQYKFNEEDQLRTLLYLDGDLPETVFNGNPVHSLSLCYFNNRSSFDKLLSSVHVLRFNADKTIAYYWTNKDPTALRIAVLLTTEQDIFSDSKICDLELMFANDGEDFEQTSVFLVQGDEG